MNFEGNKKYEYKKLFQRRHFKKTVSQKKLMKNTLELLKYGLAQKEGKFLKDNQESVK